MRAYHLFYPLVTLSPCHLVTLSPCQLITLSPYHLVTLSPCHLVTLSPRHLTSEHPSFLTPSRLIGFSRGVEHLFAVTWSHYTSMGQVSTIMPGTTRRSSYINRRPHSLEKEKVRTASAPTSASSPPAKLVCGTKTDRNASGRNKNHGSNDHSTHDRLDNLATYNYNQS